MNSEDRFWTLFWMIIVFGVLAFTYTVTRHIGLVEITAIENGMVQKVKQLQCKPQSTLTWVKAD